MNGRVTAANGRSEGRPSRQINVVLRSANPTHQQCGSGTRTGPFAEPCFPAQSIPGNTKELDQLVGLEQIKDLVFEIYALLPRPRCVRKQAY